MLWNESRKKNKSKYKWPTRHQSLTLSCRGNRSSPVKLIGFNCSQVQLTTVRFPEGHDRLIDAVTTAPLHFLPQCIMEEILSLLRRKVDCRVRARLTFLSSHIFSHQFCKHIWVGKNFTSSISTCESPQRVCNIKLFHFLLFLSRAYGLTAKFAAI